MSAPVSRRRRGSAALAALLLPSGLLLALATPGAAQERSGPPRERAAEPAESAPEAPAPPSWAAALEWRSIGPANMSGRITALAVVESDPTTWWAATASGGLLKTTNNGVSFEHQFDREATVSIGDVAVSQSDPDVVWVGTGESNPRNSVSWGNGVYKSTDGGATWTHTGLDESFQIGGIAIHPTNPDVVYVGALGRLWGENAERGLFKTQDGGETWEQVLFVDEHTGVVDVNMHPTDPETLIVATYERQRDGFDTNDPAKRWGPGSGLHKTTDGGRTWRRLTAGLPQGELGRVDVDYWRGDPSVLFAVIESAEIGSEPEDAPWLGLSGEDADVGARLTEVVADGPAATAGLKPGDIVVAVDDETVQGWADLVAKARRHLAGHTVKVEVSRDREPVVVDLTLGKRPGAEEDQGEGEGAEGRRGRGGRGGGEREERSPFRTRLGGQVPNVQDQQGPDGHEYGGVYRSDDGGESWRRINSLNPRPMYFSHVRVDPSDVSHVWVCGIPLYHSDDAGETFDDDGTTRDVHVDHHALWIDPADGRHMILGNDGGIYVTWDRGERWDHLNHVAIGQFYDVGVGPRIDYRVYGGLQDNGSWGGPARSRTGGAVNEDWIRIGGGDGFVCRVDANDPDLVYYESQNGGLGRWNLRTGDRGFLRPRAPRGTRYRFNWKTPFLLSSHNSGIYYTAGNHVFRSWLKGDDLEAISPEITHDDRGSATALAESPLDAGVLYVGTDDGALWATTDGGATWTDLFPDPAEPEPAAGPEVAAADAPEGADGDADADADPETGVDGAAAAPVVHGDRGPLPEELAEARQADAEADAGAEAEREPARAERGGGPPQGERPRRGGRGGRDRGERPADGGRPGAERPARRAGGRAVAVRTQDAPAEAAAEDPVSGTWEGRFLGEVPGGDRGVSFVLALAPDGAVHGSVTTERMGEQAITEGRWTPAERRLAFAVDSGEGMVVDFSGTLEEGVLAGAIDVGGGMFTMDFEARRTAAGPGHEAAAAERELPPSRPIAELLPGRRWVASLEASRFEAGRVYAAFDGHRSDDDRTYALVSEDHGATWRSLTDGLPEDAGSARVLREDRANADLLYLGCEFGAWVSIDRGATWAPLAGRADGALPTVAVHELAQHPVLDDVIAATHGRSLWVLDVSLLRQLDAETLAQDAHLFTPPPVHYWRSDPSRGTTIRSFVGAETPDEARIAYSLGRPARRLRLEVHDVTGEPVAELEGPTEPGVHVVRWNLRGEPEGRRRRGPRVAPGTYLVRLTVDGTTHTAPLVVDVDPEHPDVVLWGELYDERLEIEALFEEEDGAEEEGERELD